MPYYISPPPQGPLAKVLTAIVAALVLTGTFMIGVAALVVVAAVGLVAGLAIWIRITWIRRQLQKSAVDLHVKTDVPSESGHIIDAEYTVVSESVDQDNT